MRIRTQATWLETTASTLLSIDMTPRSSAAANNPPSTPPSAEVATIEGNREPATDGGSSLMKSFQFQFALGFKPVCHAPKDIALRVGCRSCSTGDLERPLPCLPSR